MEKVDRITVRDLGLHIFIRMGVTSKENFPEDGNTARLLNAICIYIETTDSIQGGFS
jgi:hypothetical protein